MVRVRWGAAGEAGGVSRRGVLAGASVLAGLGLAGCEVDPASEPVLVAAPPPAEPPAPVEPPVRETALRSLIGDGDELVVGGERMNAGLLRRYYGRHGWEPVWAERERQADNLAEAVGRAREHGLDPALFHARLLADGAGLSPLERDVALSDAFLGYADALARGAVPVERRKNDEVLAPEPVDVAAVLDEAVAGDDPAAVVEALAPGTPTYRALREALRAHRPGLPGRRAVVAAERLRAIVVNLERQRWLPRRLPANRVWVNVADEKLVMFRGDEPAFKTRVVVGEDVEKNQSPEFSATINASFYNPPWVIPADIASAEVLPKLDGDPDYLTKNKMVLLANGEVEQLPGPDAGLGYVMFDMPNRFDVYLHDTPDRTVFSRDNRRISHGCIRVQNPRELAALLLDKPLDAVNDGIAEGSTTRNDLPAPVPVFVVYQTAFVDEAGTLQFRRDFYDRDATIWKMMRGAV